jgi:hypothetical protein
VDSLPQSRQATYRNSIAVAKPARKRTRETAMRAARAPVGEVEAKEASGRNQGA